MKNHIQNLRLGYAAQAKQKVNTIMNNNIIEFYWLVRLLERNRKRWRRRRWC